ncbi:MAG: GNAT family N-acetyltransferase [Myxococcota bacterium]|nr:GNAT family N-acetyltransferase [Myxococcota bacterium]
MEPDRTLHLVEPSGGIGEALEKVLAEDGIAFRSYPDAERFLEDGPTGALDDACLLVEAELPGASGVSLVKTLRERGARAPMIVLTGAFDRELHGRALAAGATELLERTLITVFLAQRLARIWPATAAPRARQPATVELGDGTPVTFRQIYPEDADLVTEFVGGLSETSRYMRFFTSLRELPPSVLKDFTNPRFPDTYAVIATADEPDADGQAREREIGVARYVSTGEPGTAEFALVVADDWQRRGVATRLMRLLTTAAAVAGIETLEGLVLRHNAGMLELCRGLGFLPSGSSGDPTVVRVARELRGGAPGS